MVPVVVAAANPWHLGHSVVQGPRECAGLHLGQWSPTIVCGDRLLLLARSDATHSAGPPTREQDLWDESDRRKLQLSRLSYWESPWRPDGELGQRLHLETKTLMLESPGQHVEEAATDDPAEDRPINRDPPDSTGGRKSLPVRCTQAAKREDSVSLRKHLGHARRLASAVKQGRGYFQLLQTEEQEEQEEEERRRRRREERQRAEPRPPRLSSDSDSDEDGPRRKKSQSARPFTPVHRSLTSPLLSEAPCEAIYRQLCCLNWLLEALSLERSGRAGPITSCWDPKDPGRGRTTPKTLNKERAIESKWEQFVYATKPRRTGPRLGRSSSGRLQLLRKSSSLSAASSSALTAPTAGSSLSSLGPGAEEETGTATTGQDMESPAGAEETEPPTSEYLRTLLDEVHQSVKRELYGQSPRTSSTTDSLTASPVQPQPPPQSTDNPTASRTAERCRPKSCPAKPLSATSQLINSKASMLLQLRAAYEERAEEMAQSYADILEHNARKRLNSGLQKYRALRHMTGSHRRPPRHVTWPSVTKVKAPETGAAAEGEGVANSNNNNKHSNNMWLSTLLRSLPAEVCEERAVSRVLEKLSGFADERTPRVRPHLFLKVLGGLQPWELCLPDLCVAVEIAREHVVQMPREEYDAWLCSRVALPSQYHRASNTR
ncbi:coiled-coil domain-containing protein 60-like [Centroberyx gerrardi]